MSDDAITIHGRSDDLIEVEGTVTEELYANYGEPTTVHVGPWAFEVVYNSDGEWEITPTNVPDGESVTLWSVGGHPQFPDYTQAVEFDGSLNYEVTVR